MAGCTFIPNEAIAAAWGDPLFLGAVLHIYAHADRRQWRSFEAARPWLQKAWGVSWRKADKICAALSAEGLIVWTKGVKGGSAARIEVLKPVLSVKKAGKNVGKNVGKVAGNQSTDQQPIIADSGQGGGQERGQDRGHIYHSHSSPHTQQDPPIAPRGAPPCPSLSAALTSLIEPDKPAPKKTSPSKLKETWAQMMEAKGGRALKLTEKRRLALRGRLKEHTAEEICGVMRWWQTSPHQRASFLREKGCTIDTLLRASNLTGYAEMAAEGAGAAGIQAAVVADAGIRAESAFTVLTKHRSETRDSILGWLPEGAHKRFTAGVQAMGLDWSELSRTPVHKLTPSRDRFIAAFNTLEIR